MRLLQRGASGDLAVLLLVLGLVEVLLLLLLLWLLVLLAMHLFQWHLLACCPQT